LNLTDFFSANSAFATFDHCDDIKYANGSNPRLRLQQT